MSHVAVENALSLDQQVRDEKRKGRSVTRRRRAAEALGAAGAGGTVRNLRAGFAPRSPAVASPFPPR